MYVESVLRSFEYLTYVSVHGITISMILHKHSIHSNYNSIITYNTIDPGFRCQNIFFKTRCMPAAGERESMKLLCLGSQYAFVRMWMCVCVCVSTPKAMKN